VIEEVAACSARLVVNPASFHARRQAVTALVQKLEEARG